MNKKVNSLNAYMNSIGALIMGAILVLVILIFTNGQIKQSLGLAILFLIPFTLLFIWKYPIAAHKVIVRDNYLQLGAEAVVFRHVRKAYELGPLQKFLLSFCFQKKHVYTNSLFGNGLLLRLNSNSYYVVDYVKIPPDTPVKFIRGLAKNRLLNYLILLIIPALPILLVILALEGVSPLLLLLLILFILKEMLNAYYMSFLFSERLDLSEIEAMKLHDEGLEKDLKNVTLLKGLIPAALPGRIVNGLTLNLLFRKYIILNFSIMEHSDGDVRDYVFYHELGHVKMNHGVLYPFFTPLLIIFILLSPALPSMPLPNYLPSYTGLVLVFLILLLGVLLRYRTIKNELSADIFAISRMGFKRVIRVLSQFHVNEAPSFIRFGYLSPKKRIEKLMKIRRIRR